MPDLDLMTGVALAAAYLALAVLVGRMLRRWFP